MRYSTSFFSAWSLFLALGWVESVPPHLHGCFPPWGPVITMRGLIQPFLSLPAPSSWKLSTLAGPALMGPGGESRKPPPPEDSSEVSLGGWRELQEGPGWSQLSTVPPTQELGSLGGR